MDNDMEKYKFPRKAVHKIYGNVIVYGFFQVGNLESGYDPQAVVEIIETGQVEVVNPDNLKMSK